MHFWIDKRSQQCGFGRSRVAASLSHGSGLSYGHPPRRSKSSTSHAVPPVHNNRTQQQMHHHHQQQQQQQQAYHQHASQLAGTSATITTTADCHVSGRSQQVAQHHHHQQQQQQQQQSSQFGNSNNNNGGSHTSNTPTQLNNNAAYLQQQSTLSGSGMGSGSSNNNNNIATTSSAAVLTGSGTIVPVATSALSGGRTHLGRHQQSRSAVAATAGGASASLAGVGIAQTAGQQYDVRNYHHPQFGNMAVRHYQQQQQHQQHQSSSANESHHYQQPARHLYCQQELGTVQSVHNSQQEQHLAQHHATRQTAVYGPPRRNNSSSNMRANGNNSVQMGTSSAPTTTTTNNSYQQHQMQQQQQQQQQQNQTQQQTLEHAAESQLLPSHLKCGMCASLVLASVFVAGAKFYFDHQGTGLEVLIFCAFSATFFLAACTVSLCRVPKGFLPARSSSRLSELAMCEAQHSGVNGICRLGNGARNIHTDQGTRHATIATQATAGPPPYHIAILLPEHTRAEHNKQVPVDESPPPSYDKILI